MNDHDKTAGQPNDDAVLVAFIDGELSEAERARITERLDRDSDLRERLEALRQAEPRIRAAFDDLLNDAPVARMKARLGQALHARQRRVPPRWLTGVAAAATLAGVFFAGFVTSRFVGSDGGARPDDWRQAVAEYMELYSPETFRPQQSVALEKDVSDLGDRLGLALNPDRLRVSGLDLQHVEVLQYEGAPLGQLGYLEGTTLVAFCILRDGEPDAPLATASQGDFQTASWAKGGRGYMVIGKLPADEIAEVAGELIQRF